MSIALLDIKQNFHLNLAITTVALVRTVPWVLYVLSYLVCCDCCFRVDCSTGSCVCPFMLCVPSRVGTNPFQPGTHCWASNLHFFTHPLSLLFLFISFFCHSFPSSNCSSHCIIGLFTWFANYANDCCWFRFLVQNVAFPQLTQGFRSWSRFPQPTPDSAAVFLNAMF